MDQKKLPDVSMKNPLKVIYVHTKYGLTCKQAELKCVRCSTKTDIVVPDEIINGITSEEELAETDAVTVIAEMKGWITRLVRRKERDPAIYMLCPGCISKDLDEDATR